MDNEFKFKLLNYIEENVKELCLTSDFDNGKFWAFKEVQQLILFLEGRVQK